MFIAMFLMILACPILAFGGSFIFVLALTPKSERTGTMGLVIGAVAMITSSGLVIVTAVDKTHVTSWPFIAAWFLCLIMPFVIRSRIRRTSEAGVKTDATP